MCAHPRQVEGELDSIVLQPGDEILLQVRRAFGVYPHRAAAFQLPVRASARRFLTVASRPGSHSAVVWARYLVPTCSNVLRATHNQKRVPSCFSERRSCECPGRPSCPEHLKARRSLARQPHATNPPCPARSPRRRADELHLLGRQPRHAQHDQQLQPHAVHGHHQRVRLPL